MIRQMEYLKNFSEVGRPLTFRDAARNAVVELASWSRQRGLSRPRVHFLYVHHVLDDEQQGFDDLLASLSKGHTFLSHSEAVQRVIKGDIDKPYISISIDDGLKNGLRIADQLEQYGARGCFFVCPSMAANPSYHAAKEFCNRQLSLPAAEFMNWSDMRGLLKRGHEIGNHTLGHLTLSSLDEVELADQINIAHETMVKELGPIDHFAWPRGTFRHMSQAAVDRVFATGHLSCASAVRGSHVAKADNPQALCIRRDHIIAAWPLRHSLYFISQSAKTASAESNKFNWQ